MKEKMLVFSWKGENLSNFQAREFFSIINRLIQLWDLPDKETILFLDGRNNVLEMEFFPIFHRPTNKIQMILPFSVFRRGMSISRFPSYSSKPYVEDKQVTEKRRH